MLSAIALFCASSTSLRIHESVESQYVASVFKLKKKSCNRKYLVLRSAVRFCSPSTNSRWRCGEQSPSQGNRPQWHGVSSIADPRADGFCWRRVFSVFLARCFSKHPLDQSAFFFCAMRFESRSTSNVFPYLLSRGRECFAYRWLVKFCVELSFRKSTAPTFSLPPATSDKHVLPSLLQN